MITRISYKFFDWPSEDRNSRCSPRRHAIVRVMYIHMTWKTAGQGVQWKFSVEYRRKPFRMHIHNTVPSYRRVSLSRFKHVADALYGPQDTSSRNDECRHIFSAVYQLAPICTTWNCNVPMCPTLLNWFSVQAITLCQCKRNKRPKPSQEALADGDFEDSVWSFSFVLSARSPLAPACHPVGQCEVHVPQHLAASSPLANRSKHAAAATSAVSIQHVTLSTN